MVLFSEVTQSPCGGASGATGPFYCPADRKAYLDTGFFRVMSERLGAGGDFAAAYVIAHEVAHHVQNELGILPKVNQRRRQVSETESNKLSVMVELQADCFSGVWARQAQARFGSLEDGDADAAATPATLTVIIISGQAILLPGTGSALGPWSLALLALLPMLRSRFMRRRAVNANSGV